MRIVSSEEAQNLYKQIMANAAKAGQKWKSADDRSNHYAAFEPDLKAYVYWVRLHAEDMVTGKELDVSQIFLFSEDLAKADYRHHMPDYLSADFYKDPQFNVSEHV